MKTDVVTGTVRPIVRRLPKPERRRQLLDTARLILREEGVDRLTLGNLAKHAGVSKPVVYDHFKTRSVLRIDLYRWIDMERVDAVRAAMSAGNPSQEEAIYALSSAYIGCAADTQGEFPTLGAALAGSEEKAAVFDELLDSSVQMFISGLKTHSTLSMASLERICLGLVGAGEALATAVVRGKCREADAVATFAAMIQGGLHA